MKFNFLTLILFVFIISQNKVFSGTLKANASSIDITPPLEMKYTLGGYGERMNRPAEGIHDHIWAKALVVKDADKKYAIVTIDILGLPTNVKVDLLKRISTRGWSKENIMLLPSHSHGSLEMAAVNSKNVFGVPQVGIFQPELLEFLIGKIDTLILNADKNYREVKIGTKSAFLDGLNRNRRGDPEVDNELMVTRIDLLNGKPFAVLVNWTAHPTFIDGEDMLVSAEWPGYLQSDMEKVIGNDVTVMYYNGAEGDQSPVYKGQGNAYDKIQGYGKIIAEKAMEVYGLIQPKTDNVLTFDYQVIDLPKQVAHPDFMETGGKEYGLNEETVKIIMDALGPKSVGMGAVRIGDLVIAGVPGEMTAGLGIQVKKNIHESGAKYVAIGGLANEWISYILSRERYTKGGGYESSVSFYGPELGDIISKEIVKVALPLTN